MTEERDERDEEPLIATYTLGLDWRPCIMDCNRKTQNADSVCERHDFFACCGQVLVPNDQHGHEPWCRTPDRLPYHMERGQ